MQPIGHSHPSGNALTENLAPSSTGGHPKSHLYVGHTSSNDVHTIGIRSGESEQPTKKAVGVGYEPVDGINIATG